MKKLTFIILALLILAAQGNAQNLIWSQNGKPATQALSILDPTAALDANGDGTPDVPSFGSSHNHGMQVVSGANPNEEWRFPLTGTTQNLKGIELIGFFDVRMEPGKEAVLGKRKPNGIIAILISDGAVGIVHEFDENWRLVSAGNLDGEPGDELLFYDPVNDKMELWGK